MVVARHTSHMAPITPLPNHPKSGRLPGLSLVEGRFFNDPKHIQWSLGSLIRPKLP